MGNRPPQRAELDVNAMRDELVARMRLADDVLEEYAKQNKTTVDAISPAIAEAVRKACITGLDEDPSAL